MGYLEGLYAPVAGEETALDLEVEGELPAELRGVYLRNGPNPRHAPRGRYHWFDGDGMVHAVHLEGGRASYRSRWIHTAAYQREGQAGAPLWDGIMERIRPDTPDGRPDKDTANTDLVWHGGKLLALWWLGGQPYRLDPVELSTQGPEDFAGTLSCGVASHPKVDPVTGELVFMDFDPYRSPYLTYGVASAEGRVTTCQAVEVPGPRIFHDLAITPNYTVLLDLPLLWDTSALDQRKRRIRFDPSLPSRLGVVPRAGGEVRWFEAEAGYVYHTINAWEEEGAIVLTACRIADPSPQGPPGTEPEVPHLAFLRMEPYLYRWRLDLTTGQVTEGARGDVPTEFPRMDPRRLGRRSRWAYCPRLARESTLLFDALMKVDLESGETTTVEHGPGCFADEVVFAPRAGGSEEDDGWLLAFVHDRAQDRHELRVWDARDPRRTLARVRVPARVPIGFHAHWVPGEELGG